MNDPIERLSAANPVPGAVDHPDPQLLQEILMTTTTPTRPSDEVPSAPGSVPGSTRRRMPAILAAAAALLVLAGVVGALIADDDTPASDVASAPDRSDDPAADPVVPGPPAGSSDVTSCIENWSPDAPDTLRNRDYAFDGTVASVDGGNMTFTVNEWFSGGTEPTITLDHQGLEGMLFAPEGPALEPGTRVLVAGDGGFVWSCGFTLLHDDATAGLWRAALAG